MKINTKDDRSVLLKKINASDDDQLYAYLYKLSDNTDDNSNPIVIGCALKD